jgi:gliding motility-associated-like protein
MRLYILGILLFVGSLVSAQISNDECQFATHLGIVTDYCSGETEFSNVGASQSAEATPFCFFGGNEHDLWYSVTPGQGGLYISVSGTLGSPSIAVYEGNCNALNEISCSSTAAGFFAETSVFDLLIGQTYYIRVDGRDGRTGEFQLCVRSFAPVKTPESDCKDAVVLCDKSPFAVENLNSFGDLEFEMTGSCIQVTSGPNNQQREQASVWYVWTCKDSGTLEFSLTPNNPNNDEEDLDFIVYEMPGGLEDCDNRESVRCMLSGETGGLDSSPCYGATGLRAGSNDTEEFAGCQDTDDNFLAPLDMVAGQSYGLIINNFSMSGFGFTIEFGGTGTFLGPEPDFEINELQAFECDKTVAFTDLSESQTDPITNWSWSFGAGSNPSFSNQMEPTDVIYDSFGDKVAALTIESSRGCLVTKSVEFFVEPCCQDTSTLGVDGLATDVDCFGDEDGEIFAEGFSGSPEYSYSLDGINFQPNPRFLDLPAGDYELFIVDIKGCRDTTLVPIFQPTQTVADAGPDMTVDLGSTGIIDGSVFSDFDITNISWSPLDSFVNCTECLTPEVFPLGATTYTLTVTDENGCTSSDDVQFLINVVRPVFWPNIFSPNEDNVNDFFNISGGPAIDRIESLKVYDRWGNLMYDGMPELNSRQDGWDGTFNGKDVNPGVYAWIAAIRFIDRDLDGNNVVLNYSGDITVIR